MSTLLSYIGVQGLGGVGSMWSGEWYRLYTGVGGGGVVCEVVNDTDCTQGWGGGGGGGGGSMWSGEWYRLYSH